MSMANINHGDGGVYMFLGAALLGGKWKNGMTVLQASCLHINYYKSHFSTLTKTA